jgi:hypothetical protein
VGSTTPDDVFYILKVVLNRLLGTGSVATVTQAVDGIRDVMDRGYAGVMKRKLDEVYRNAGAGGGTRAEKAERESRISFIVSHASLTPD